MRGINQPNTYKVTKSNDKIGWIYYYYNNVQGNRTLTENCTFKTFEGLELMAPHSGNGYKI